MLTRIQSTVFDSLAHEIVHQTSLSLANAATQIATRVSPTDANLFLLSHLLALKHHILAFEIEFAATDVRVDLPSSLVDLRDTMLNPASWMRALGGGFVPRVVTDMKDARTDVDDRLRAVIGSLVHGWSARMTAPMTRGSSTETTRGRSDVRKGSATVADAEEGALAREALAREVPLVRRKLDEYMQDRRTKDMLLRAVLEEVLVKYAGWLESKGLDGPLIGRSKAKGKGREDGVWEEETFAQWALGVFGLETLEEDDGEGDDDRE
jgi:hypothetical protein